jgi:hypothetical protein
MSLMQAVKRGRGGGRCYGKRLDCALDVKNPLTKSTKKPEAEQGFDDRFQRGLWYLPIQQGRFA